MYNFVSMYYLLTLVIETNHLSVMDFFLSRLLFENFCVTYCFKMNNRALNQETADTTITVYGFMNLLIEGSINIAE